MVRSAFASKRSFVRFEAWKMCSVDKHLPAVRFVVFFRMYAFFYLFTKMMVCLHSRVSVFISTCLCVAISVDLIIFVVNKCANRTFVRFLIHFWFQMQKLIQLSKELQKMICFQTQTNFIRKKTRKFLSPFHNFIRIFLRSH